MDKPVVKFTCVAYPFLRVLIERSGNKVGGDRFAEFRFGNYETDDEKEIETLRKTPFVYEDAKLNLAQVHIEIDPDKPIAPDTRARLTNAERAAQKVSATK